MPIPASEHTVTHISTVPANKGDAIELLVREYDGTKPHHQPEPVLMLHGRSAPALAGFDLQHENGKYSWAQNLADAGYDVFIMDLQGSGRSPRPKMDKPCNANPAQQQDLLVKPLAEPLAAKCDPVYTSQLGNSQSDWAELNAVVDYITKLREVSKIALVGWSAAAFQIGPYAMHNAAKVASLLLLAPIFPPQGRTSAPAALPVSTPPAVFGFPMNLGTKAGFTSQWDKEQHCHKQRDAGMVDVVWKAIMENDSVGKAWGPKEANVPQGVMRIRNSVWWGWNIATVSDSTLGETVPVLIVYGDLDTQCNTSASSGPLLHFSVPALYEAIPGPKKLMFRVACTGHSMVWERHHKLLHQMSRQWLKHTAVEGLSSGSYFRDEDGVYLPAK
ncbi:alpha/beta fold hydrolase [Streptomyces sp. NPDC001549]|uniref:alpha/beta fold hydrolase n=1 Tax=Streptomyces sp. NPDC001549 TaxID=3364586 RepID=UPI00367B8A5B